MFASKGEKSQKARPEKQERIITIPLNLSLEQMGKHLVNTCRVIVNKPYISQGDRLSQHTESSLDNLQSDE